MNAKKKINNNELIDILKEVLAAMEVKQVNRFRIRSYQNVITSIESLTQPVYDLWQNNRLDDISGVGTAIKQHFEDLFTTGHVKDFEMVKKDLPEGMFSLIGLRGIGAKKAFKLASAFELNDREHAIEKIKEAAENHEIQVLEGFGEKSEKDILEAVSEMKMHKKEKERMLLIHAEEIADRVISYIKKDDNVTDAQALGSLRRRSATVGDLDIAVATNNPEETIKHFLEFPEIDDVMGSGEKGSRAVLTNDVQVDMRTTSPDAYGAMLQYFTGSKLHNINLRKLALDKGMSLSEHGIKHKKELKKFSTEKDFYNHIGIDYIPPEIRQGKDEVELSRDHKLPKLVEVSDIKGDLHTHTTFSDGENTLEEMISSAKSKGYQYLGISDHAPSVNARGEKEVLSIIDEQLSRFEQINSSDSSFDILFGYEVNILKNAELSMPNEIMKKLDYVIASIHTSFDQSRDEVTNRMINALENPYVSIIGHPSGRLINQREGCDFDWNRVLNAAKENNKILEINSQPNRLDLADDLVYEAVKRGINIIINSDAHSVDGLDAIPYGVDVARRGWCESKNIVNTLSFKELLKVLKLARNNK